MKRDNYEGLFMVYQLLIARPKRNRTLICAFFALTAIIIVWAVFATISSSRQMSGLLVPRQSSLTWESPNADGPIVAETAELLFVLDNPGRQPVRVVGIDTTCGCVRPVADPPYVVPGGMTNVVVRATTPSTGTSVLPLIVHTDSSRPDVRLTARLVVRRRPPYLYDVTGHLIFRGTFSPNLTCDFEVVTFESGKPTVAPDVSTELPFLKVEKPESIR
jgi:hypothetical protein